MSEFSFETNFVSVDSQEKGAEFEVINDQGKKTGFFIKIAGPDSQRRKKTRARIAEHLMKNIGRVQPQGRAARRAAQESTGDSASTLRELQLDDLVAATMEWRYPKDFSGPQCTPENIRKLYEKHPTLFEQVAEAADDLDRFTRG